MVEKIENEDNKSQTIDKFRDAMKREFVPPDETAKAKIELIDIKMKGYMDERVKRFKKPIKMTGTSLKEEYVYFFMIVPSAYKEEFHKKLPRGKPRADTVMSVVFKFARDVATSKHWRAE
ncbi:unnamed protein product [Agarophyton chilense]